MNDTEIIYCGEGWENFWAPYNSISTYAQLTVATIGVLTNILNIIIFTRKSMSSSPINKILVGLALADFLSCLRYIIEGITALLKKHYEYQDSYVETRHERRDPNPDPARTVPYRGTGSGRKFSGSVGTVRDKNLKISVRYGTGTMFF